MIKQYTASGIVFKDNKILLINHNKLHTWIYPGGHIEKGESPDECLKREIFEETGYKIEIVNTNIFNYCDSRAKTIPRPFCVLEENVTDECEHKHIDFIYVCKVNDDRVYGCPEYDSKKWFSKEEIMHLDMMENFRFVLLEAFKRLNDF